MLNHGQKSKYDNLCIDLLKRTNFSPVHNSWCTGASMCTSMYSIHSVAAYKITAVEEFNVRQNMRPSSNYSCKDHACLPLDDWCTFHFAIVNLSHITIISLQKQSESWKICSTWSYHQTSDTVAKVTLKFVLLESTNFPNRCLCKDCCKNTTEDSKIIWLPLWPSVRWLCPIRWYWFSLT